ncbi:hypothetical protein D910_05631 [Dendroctonus ponderosae]|uniref:Uncharacterized protein n=1 Tax=Dendroctonus ponderosae TaxID=77166 RepID=U4U7B9_DENPD|nr:hypothetical protein D910_05631 [Dendroctonus ponderosae]
MAYDKCNFIVNSEILKTQNCIENKARKEWKAKWGFYLDLDKGKLVGEQQTSVL